MPLRPPQIVAFGGGGFSTEWGNPLLDDHVLALSGVERPKICFLPTASGDADHYCSGARRGSAILVRTCSPRTSSTSEAAAWSR
ncbi:MAG: Type 1 glutamine amidotransferase-like domain-containing protein [Solirubrobacteraceae bacterium]